MMARSVGFPFSHNPLDYSIEYHYEMVGVDHDLDYVDMYVGEDVSPGTHAWIIPKGVDVVYVGIGVSLLMKKRERVRAFAVDRKGRRGIAELSGLEGSAMSLSRILEYWTLCPRRAGSPKR